MRDEEEQAERPRPRVIDKRISARGDAAEVPAPAPEEPPAPPPEEPPTPPPAQAPPPPEARPEPPHGAQDSPVWTPEQEAEARRIAAEIAQTPSLDWVVNTAVTLANVAATKIEMGDPADAGLAIDAFAGLMSSLTGRLAEAEAPLRQTLAQLQLAYAEKVGTPPPPGA